jgi:ABC-type multidrug transport system permease subunit
MELLLTCLVFSFLGVLAALLARSHQDLATFSSLILLPMTFLGGTFFSLAQVPWGLKMALYALPLTHCSICLRAAALDQPVPWGSLFAIIFFLMVFFSGCVVVLKRISV